MSDDDEPTPRIGHFRDQPDSRFYRSRRLSPEATWDAAREQLGRVLSGAREAFFGRRMTMSVERVRWWHGAIFHGLFPHDGGRFREAHEPTEYGVRRHDGTSRRLQGAPHTAIQRELTALCEGFNERVEELSSQREIDLIDATRAVATLYAGILRIHPFVDGNHRTAFVALSAALWSLGLPSVEFATDEELRAHDRAIAVALLPAERDVEPFAELLAGRIRLARKETS